MVIRSTKGHSDRDMQHLQSSSIVFTEMLMIARRLSASEGRGEGEGSSSGLLLLGVATEGECY